MNIYEEISKTRNIEWEIEKNSIMYNNISYFIIDTEGTIIEMSQKAALLYQINEDINIKNLIYPPNLNIFNDFLTRIFSSNESQSCIIRFINQDYTKNIEIEGTCFKNKKNCLLSINEMDDYETLKLSEIRYRKLFETSKEGILVLNAESGKVIDINHVLLSMIGGKDEEFIGLYIWDICVFKDIVKSEEEYRSLSKKEDFKLVTLKTYDGNYMNVEILSSIYQYDNRKEIQYNIRDISERIKYEKMLEETKERLEELNKTKDKFFSIISHDLRSPFNSIIGFSDLIIRKIEEKSYEDLKNYAEKIQKSSWHAMNLLSNLIEWSRSQNGKIVFKPDCFILGLLIDEVFLSIEDAAEQKSIKLINCISENLKIVADRSMLNTILRNLVSNGIKFTLNGGKVIVNASDNEFETIISVCDTGIGMSCYIKDKLFRMEECYSQKGTNEEKGTGLGLLLCSEFISYHKGRIWVESEQEVGTCFYVSFPKQNILQQL